MKYTDQDLEDEIQRLYEKLEHPPNTAELNEYGEISYNVYLRRVADTWDAVLETYGYDPINSGSSAVVTDEETLLDEIKNVADEIGRRPTCAEFNGHGEYPIDRYYSVFGSWADAIEQAGYDASIKPNQRTDTQELIDDIQHVADDIGRSPSSTEYSEKCEYSLDTVYTQFDSWDDALEAADLEVLDFRKVARRTDTQELIDDIQHVADDIGRSPSSAEYSEKCEYSLAAVYTQFDSWDDALEAADLEVLNFRKVTQITDKQELIDALREDKQRLGHVPTRDELNEKGTYTDTTYRNHFGSYNTALKKAGFSVNQQNNTLTEIECFCCGDTIQKAEWKIKDRERLFCSKECVHNATVEVMCAYCGSKTKTGHLSERQYQNSFCDESCRAQYYSRSGPAGEDIECDNCGEVFKRYEAGSGDYVFCSRECSHEFRTLSKEQLVDDLQTAYEKLPDETSLNKIAAATGHYSGPYYRIFDSLHDAAEAAGLDVPYGRTTVECENCNNSFNTRKKRARNDRRCFCNRECYFNWMRQGHLREGDERRVPDYGPNWESQRRAARKRDDFTCQSCGMTKDEHLEQYKVRPHVHHIKPWHEFDDHEERNKLSNLIVLCVACHAKWEKLPVRPQLDSKK